MEKEDYFLARKFAQTVNFANKFAQNNNLFDEDCIPLVINAICDLISIDKPALI